MKITNLEDFKIYETKRLNEALSVDRKKDAKLKILIQEARELIDAKMKLKEIAELRKIKNNELKDALEDIKEASIIAKEDINENLMNIFKNVGRYIKNLFNKFFNFAKRANLALSKL